MDREVVARRLREARQAVLASRREVEADAMVGQVEPISEDPKGDLGDIAYAEVEKEMDLSLRDMFSAELAELDAAEERLADGTYGLCEICGAPIAEERLAAVPWARRCFEHQRDLEQTRTDFKES